MVLGFPVLSDDFLHSLCVLGVQILCFFRSFWWRLCCCVLVKLLIWGSFPLKLSGLTVFAFLGHRPFSRGVIDVPFRMHSCREGFGRFCFETVFARKHYFIGFQEVSRFSIWGPNCKLVFISRGDKEEEEEDNEE